MRQAPDRYLHIIYKLNRAHRFERHNVWFISYNVHFTVYVIYYVSFEHMKKANCQTVGHMASQWIVLIMNPMGRNLPNLPADEKGMTS